MDFTMQHTLKMTYRGRQHWTGGLQWLLFFSHHIILSVHLAGIRTIVRYEHVMDGVTKKILNISKIARNIKSLFMLDLNGGVYIGQTTIELIIYVNKASSTFVCATLYA